MIGKVQIYDTTLRDGTQREGISLSLQDKISIARKLDELGVAYIEGGWPGSNPKDIDFFLRAQDIHFKNARLAAFGSTCRVGSDPSDDANIRALLDANTPTCTVVGKTWILHVKDVIRTTPEENLRIIEDSIRYLVEEGREVIYDAEHFFDGYKGDSSYAIQTLKAAYRGGADMLVLCDTNGGSLPWEISKIVHDVMDAIPESPFGIHTHNDGECAVANTLAAVTQGAVQIQGTINGYGERTGNANLCSIIPDLELKMGYECLPEGHLPGLMELSKYVAEVANLPPDDHLPYVGRSAFAHKGGIHVAAMRRNPLSYQHIDPTLVGNRSRTVVSELSGRGNLYSKAEDFGFDIDNPEAVPVVLNEIKNLEARGFSFEAAEASVALMLKRQQRDYAPPFNLLGYSVVVSHREMERAEAQASVAVQVGDEELKESSTGNGPVNALDQALRAALIPVYPHLAEFHLADYKVRILDGSHGTEAVVRVLIDTQNGTHRWSTVGASANILEASWRALADSVEYGLLFT
jgi:2-isopropylmalate synthase